MKDRLSHSVDKLMWKVNGTMARHPAVLKGPAGTGAIVLTEGRRVPGWGRASG